MKRQLKIAISCLICVLSWPVSVLASVVGVAARPRLVILYYHDIPAVSRARFARQMDKLMRRATVVAADWRGGPIKGRVCAITFDDAFVSVIDNALPELAKRQLPSTIFVPVGALGGPPGWAMEANCAPGEIVADEHLIRSLPSSLVTLGAHTMTHPVLSRLPRATARAEIEQSRTLLSAMTGQDVRLMSFPYGDYDQEVVAMCETAGYDLVYGIVPTTVDPQDSAFIRGRVAVNPDDSDLEFFLKMSGGYWWMSLASTLKQACLSPHTLLMHRKNPWNRLPQAKAARSL
ncbi:MAG TPA: polysaccharide deacetylase family protein [Acetobacteraceae bacterium]|nr:polysaccharide deacetylase family protein [Acetobacteraceae bacterium]